MCYNALQTKWLAWSKGYAVPMEKTTLRGAKVYAAIAGKDLTEPVKQHDAIWHFFFKVRGKGPEPKFRAEQLQLAVVLDYEDIARVELRREELNPDTGMNTSKVSIIQFCLHITHCVFNRPLVDVKNVKLSAN